MGIRMALENVRIADFSWVGVGPATTGFLAACGATVIRIESNTRPDRLRISAPYKDGKPGVNRSGYFPLFNANKYSIAINLKHPVGADLARKLAVWSDIVCESFTPGIMTKFGLGYKDLKKLKPDIIMISMSIHGGSGPYRQHIGYGHELVGLVGASNLTGWPDRQPSQPYGAYTDWTTPRLAASAIMAALINRNETGEGQYIDFSQFESGLQFFIPSLLDYSVNKRIARRKGNRCFFAAPHGVYRCKGEDNWCAISVLDDKQWDAFCHVIGNLPWTKEERFASLRGRKANEDDLDRLVEKWTSTFTSDEVMVLMQQGGVPAGIVHSSEGLLADPQLKHRNHFWEMKHAELGTALHLSPAFRLSKTPVKPLRPAPELGEHTEYIARTVLGIEGEEFVDLLNQGVFD